MHPRTVHIQPQTKSPPKLRGVGGSHRGVDTALGFLLEATAIVVGGQPRQVKASLKLLHNGWRCVLHAALHDGHLITEHVGRASLCHRGARVHAALRCACSQA